MFRALLRAQAVEAHDAIEEGVDEGSVRDLARESPMDEECVRELSRSPVPNSLSQVIDDDDSQMDQVLVHQSVGEFLLSDAEGAKLDRIKLQPADVRPCVGTTAVLAALSTFCCGA